MVVLQSFAQGVVGCAIAWVVIGIAAVFLRLLAKRKSRAAFSLDDAWCLFALILITVFNAVQIAAVVTAGGSLVETEMTIPQLTEYFKILYIADLLWPASITAVKLSILFFYRRLFATKKFQHTSLYVDALCWIWMLVCTFVLAFQCVPVAAAWDITLRPTGKCQPLGPMVIGPEMTNIFVDVVILSLPIHMIRGLQMQPRQKILVSLLFLFGGLVCIIGVVRIAILYRPKDEKTVNAGAGIILDSVENGSALICACLPICRPLLPKEIPPLNMLADWLHAIRTSSMLKSGRWSRGSRPSRVSVNVYSNQKVSRYAQFDSGAQDLLHLTSAEGGGQKHDRSVAGSAIPMDRIAVQDTVDVV